MWRAIVQTAIEEAGKPNGKDKLNSKTNAFVSSLNVENCEHSLTDQSPIARNIQSVMSNISPQTPKSRMLNSWNVENRNLKVGKILFLLWFIKFSKHSLMNGFFSSLIQRNNTGSIGNWTFRTWLFRDAAESMWGEVGKIGWWLQRGIGTKQLLEEADQSLDEHDQLSQIAQCDVTVRKLRREIEEKENELLRFTVVYNESMSDVETLKEKLEYAESQVKTLNTNLLESFSEAEEFKNQLEERDKMINYMNNNIKELSELLKELQSNSKKPDFDSSSSCEIHNSTANDSILSSKSQDAVNALFQS